MSYFPAWIRKTMWRRFSAAEQQNAIQATMAFYQVGSLRNQEMALMRGLPERPIWIKLADDGVPHNPSADLNFLLKRVARRLSREQKEFLQRVEKDTGKPMKLMGTPGAVGLARIAQ